MKSEWNGWDNWPKYREEETHPYGRNNLKKLLSNGCIPTKKDYIDAVTKDETCSLTRYGVVDSMSFGPFNGDGIQHCGEVKPDQKFIKQMYDENYNIKKMEREIKRLDDESIALVGEISKVLTNLPPRWSEPTIVPSGDKNFKKSLEFAFRMRNALELAKERFQELERVKNMFPTH